MDKEYSDGEGYLWIRAGGETLHHAIWTNNGILIRSGALAFTYSDWNSGDPNIKYAGLYDYSLLNTGREPLFKLSNGFSVRCVTE